MPKKLMDSQHTLSHRTITKQYEKISKNNDDDNDNNMVY